MLNHKLNFLIYLFISILGNAQNTLPSLSYLSTDNGISQALNYNILKDSRGFVWITSYDGVNRFDGTNIVKYQYDFNDTNSFYGTISQGLVEDKLENIWTGSNQCLNIYQAKWNRFKKIKIPTTSSRFYFPLYTRDSVVVFQMGSEFYAINIFNYRWEKIFENNQFKDAKFYPKCFESKSNWIIFNIPRNRLSTEVQKNGFVVYQLDKKSNKLFKTIDYKQNNYSINCVVSLDDNTFLMGTHSGLYSYDLNRNQMSKLQVLENQNILAIEKLNNGNLIASTKEGQIYELDLKTKKTTPYKLKGSQDVTELVKYDIGNIFIDKNDNIFLSLWGKGVAYCNLKNTYFDHYFTSSDLANHRIRDQYISSMLSQKNDVWIATKTGGIYLVDSLQNIKRHISFDKVFKETGFWDDIYLFHGYNQRIFITSANGIFEVKGNQLSKVNIQWGEVYPTEINDIKMHNGKYLLSANHGLILANEKFSKLEYLSGIPHLEFYIRSYIVQDKWLITCSPFKGFKVYSVERNNYKIYDSFPINASIKDFYLKSDNEFWFASTLGLIKYNLKTKKSELDNSKDKWINNYLYCILPQDKDNLWFSHNNGITHYDLSTNLTRHFDPNQGLQGNEFNTSAFCKTMENLMYFGGTFGYNVSKKDMDVRINMYSKFQLEDLKIQDQSVDGKFFLDDHEQIVLPFNKNTFSINPIFIQYSGSKSQSEFLYKLEGIDQDWIIGKSNQPIRYSGLPAGKFELKIISKDRLTSKSIFITVTQVFWKRFWFWLLCFGILSAIVWFAMRGYYLAKLRDQQAILERELAINNERNRISQELHDDLGSGLTSITFLSNSKSQGTNQKINRKSRELIQNMNEIIWAMNYDLNSTEELNIYMRRFALEFLEENQIKVKIHSELPENDLFISSELRKNAYLIFKEILHNIVKHAQATEVIIDIRMIENIHVKIHDNGKGLDLNLLNEKKGNGLQNIQKRIAKYKGEVNFINTNGTLVDYWLPFS